MNSRILLIEDEPGLVLTLSDLLAAEGHTVESATDGVTGLAKAASEPFDAIILDVMLPGKNGLDVCREIRQRGSDVAILMLTAKTQIIDRVVGLKLGADDYLTKPFDPEELRARVHVGIRMVTLQERLAERVAELEEALANVKQLRGLLPICSYCKRVRADGNYWEQVEQYVSTHSDATFSHGICPTCYDTALKDLEPV